MNSLFVTGSFYHIYNRGVEKRTIFQNVKDYYRFMETINFYRFYPTPRKLSTHLKFNSPPIPKHLDQKEIVKIVCFCLMPNHFHLLIQQIEEGGISEFVRRVSDSFTRYFNIKNKRVGPLLQGPFKSKVIEADEYLLYLTKYIHRNPFSSWKKKLKEYSFSSYAGFLNPKRNFEFCDPTSILNYFGKSRNLSYEVFVEESEDLAVPEDLLIDQ